MAIEIGISFVSSLLVVQSAIYFLSFLIIEANLFGSVCSMLYLIGKSRLSLWVSCSNSLACWKDTGKDLSFLFSEIICFDLRNLAIRMFR